MALVHVPPLMRNLTHGNATVRGSGRTVAQVLAALEAAYPGFGQRLAPDGQLRLGLAVAVDDHLAPEGLDSAVDDESAIRFVRVVGGG